MADHRRKARITPGQWKRIVEAAEVSTVARGLTHPLYRYPAAMSPQIANSLIEELTEPGDVILDPFCGGGTTAVEAVANGRRAICSDLNSIACFVTKGKATPLTRGQSSRLAEWIEAIGSPRQSLPAAAPIALRTFDGREFAPNSLGLILALRDSTHSLRDRSVQRLAQLIVLRTGQICFDCRQAPVHPGVVSDVFESVAREALCKARDFSIEAERSTVGRIPRGRLRVLQADAEVLSSRLGRELHSVSLVITSPPYPGIHVLYHRWQFRGRKEVPLPYQILNVNDGGGEAHYTLGPRHEAGNHGYFSRLGRIFSGLNQALLPGTYVVQVVSFSDPGWQCERYLSEMSQAGLIEVTHSAFGRGGFSRTIPNRRWYIRTDAQRQERREHIFVHRSTG